MSELALTKCIASEDYDDPDLQLAIQIIKDASPHADFNVPTPHRLWEYGQGLRAAAKLVRDTISIIEFGGGTSPFMPGLARLFPMAKLTEVEVHPDPLREEQAGRSVRQLQEPPQGETFDFVACVSAIENWEPILGGVEAMGDLVVSFLDYVAPKGILYITSDIGPREPDTYHFHWMRPDGIWTPQTWEALSKRLQTHGMEHVGSVDYTWGGEHVYDYSFACMTLRKHG